MRLTTKQVGRHLLLYLAMFQLPYILQRPVEAQALSEPGTLPKENQLIPYKMVLRRAAALKNLDDADINSVLLSPRLARYALTLGISTLDAKDLGRLAVEYEKELIPLRADATAIANKFQAAHSDHVLRVDDARVRTDTLQLKLQERELTLKYIGMFRNIVGTSAFQQFRTNVEAVHWNASTFSAK